MLTLLMDHVDRERCHRGQAVVSLPGYLLAGPGWVTRRAQGCR